MKNKNRAKKKRSKPSNTEQATGSIAAAEIASSINIEDKPTAARPANSPATRIPSMFYNAQNTHITGGLFVNGSNVNINNGPSLGLLHERVAPNAILNAGGRADEVRCHPGTREEVISRMEKWGDSQDSQTPPIFWLSGPAGAGKSAIMQTVAERCQERGVLQANFFFFRGDPSRSHPSPFIATLLHQIVLLYPSLRDPVANMLSNNPLIFDSTLEDQVEQLIVTPLLSLEQLSSTYRPILLLIDGLDECDSDTKRSQERILRAFDKILVRYTEACPFRVLVASRDEPQIQMAFNKLSSQCLHLYLDEKYSPESDIRVFVEAQFAEVRKTHRLAHMLSANWPSVDDIDYIVEKSSGQFIFAATVMLFIIGSSASPAVSLQRIRGITPLATKSPFSQLDAIYTYILSQVDDQEMLKDILSARILIRAVADYIESWNWNDAPYMTHDIDIQIKELLNAVNPRYTDEIFFSCLEDLTPLLKYSPRAGGWLVFHHASFSDHLLDQSRSGDYFVDTAAFTYKFLQQLCRETDHGQRRESWVVFSLCIVNLLGRLPPGIMSLLASSVQSTRPVIEGSYVLYRAIKKVYNLCITDDDIHSYRRFLRVCLNKDNFRKYKMHDILNMPYGYKYLMMAYAQGHPQRNPEETPELRPESEFDRQELTSWLNELFDCIRNQPANSMPQRRQLIEQWSSWADLNGIPRDGLHTQ